MSVALVIQHAKCTNHTTLSFVTCPAQPHISTLSHQQHDFFKVTEHKVCSDFLYNFCLKYFTF